jgi:hypothetical protein
MRGELGIGPVDLRVIQIGLVHSGLQVVRHQPGRDAAEEPERSDVALGPGPLVHPQDRPHEHVPRTGQHHHERPHGPQLPGDRVQPPAQLPVVDLRLLPGLRWVRVPHRHLRPAGLLRDIGGDIAAEACHAGRQAVLVPQPLVDGRHPHPGLHLGDDVVVVTGDRRPRHLPQPGIGQLREPAPHQLMPLLLALRRAARGNTRPDRRGNVLPERLAVHIQAAGHLAQRPARMPVHEYLGHVDHVERSPCHRPPAVLDGRQDCSFSMARSTTTRTSSPRGIT